MSNSKIIPVSTPEIATKTPSSNKRLTAALSRIKNCFPVLDGNRVVLPESAENRVAVSLYGSSDPFVITPDCELIEPLEDVTVNLFYRVTDLDTEEALETDDPIVVKVTGKYENGEKNRPSVLPAIRQWVGFPGNMCWSGRIVFTDPIWENAAQMISFYLTEMTGKKVSVSCSTPKSGDLVLITDPYKSLGEEGYTLTVGDTVMLKAGTYRGMVYGGATVAQILMQSPDNAALPRGLARDYPQYPIRAFMIDTARYHMSIPYLTDIVRYAGFFKINAMHLHLNDGDGETKISFRLENETFPALNRDMIDACENGREKVYKKKDFIALQKAAEAVGVTVIPEIDTPSHCGAIGKASASPEAEKAGFRDARINGWQIDLRDSIFDNTVHFVQRIFDEYLDGDDPVFRGKFVHIGTDEWIRNADLEALGMTKESRNETMRRYTDEMIRYLAAKGKTPIVWNGMNVKGKAYSGDTPISHDAVFENWSLAYSDLGIALDGEYRIINSNDVDLYVVLGGNYYKTDFDLPDLYNGWNVGRFSSYAKWEQGERENHTDIAEGHPLLMGASTAFWLDVNCASSHLDIFKFLKKQMILISEKCWAGAPTEDRTLDDFMTRLRLLTVRAPGANPARYYPAAADGVLLDYDFTSAEGLRVADRSGNGYDAVLSSLNAGKEGVKLDGKGYITSAVKTVNDPYAADMTLTVSSATVPGAVLLSGEDGILRWNEDNTGKLSFTRKGYTYRFDTVLPHDKEITLGFVCSEGKTRLFVNGKLSATAYFVRSEYELNAAPKRILTTFQLPLERIGEGIVGNIAALRVRIKDETDAF